MTEASEVFGYLCGWCGVIHHNKGHDYCDNCESVQGITKGEHHASGGHIPSRDDGGEWSATMQNATRYFLIQALGITPDTPHRLVDLAAMLDRQHTAVLQVGAKLERDLELSKDLLSKALELGLTQASTIEKQQKTIDQYGGILAKAVERLGA